MVQDRRKNTEDCILNGAAAIIVEAGVPGVTVNGLADRADVAKPLIYRYFGDITGVLTALWEREADAVTPIPRAFADANEQLAALLVLARQIAASPVVAAFLADGLRPGSPWGACADVFIKGDETPSAGDQKHVSAFLTGAAIFLLLRRGVGGAWMGCSLATPNDMAAFEFALADLVKAQWSKWEATS